MGCCMIPKKRREVLKKRIKHRGRGGKGLGGYVVSVLTRRGESGTNPRVAWGAFEAASSIRDKFILGKWHEHPRVAWGAFETNK